MAWKEYASTNKIYAIGTRQGSFGGLRMNKMFRGIKTKRAWSRFLDNGRATIELPREMLTMAFSNLSIDGTPQRAADSAMVVGVDAALQHLCGTEGYGTRWQYEQMLEPFIFRVVSEAWHTSIEDRRPIYLQHDPSTFRIMRSRNPGASEQEILT